VMLLMDFKAAKKKFNNRMIAWDRPPQNERRRLQRRRHHYLPCRRRLNYRRRVSPLRTRSSLYLLALVFFLFLLWGLLAGKREKSHIIYSYIFTLFVCPVFLSMTHLLCLVVTFCNCLSSCLVAIANGGEEKQIDSTKQVAGSLLRRRRQGR
jgi:hypothetical protein